MKFHSLAISQLTVATLACAKAFATSGIHTPRAFLASRNLLQASTVAFSTAAQHQEIHAPVGEDGAGEYTAATKGCFDVIDKSCPLVLESVKSILKNKKDSSFSVADFGTADGGTSLGLMTKIVQQIREHSKDQEIILNYEDQLINEWKSVFRHALGEIPVQDAYGKLIQAPTAVDDNVFVQACGVGFHSQCFPKETIDLGVSYTAMHWLSASPNSLKGRTEMHAARCKDIDQLPEKKQAAADWKTILEARAKELKPGGRLVLVNFCVSKEGYFLGQTNTGASMWDSFAKSWQKLYDDGLIDENELKGVSFPNYYRTTNEFLEGVDQVEGLKVVSSEEHVVPCPYREQWLAGNTAAFGVETPKEYAEWFVPTTRTWSQSTFASGLRSDRSQTEKDAILKAFWQNYMDLVAQDPGKHGMDYVHNYLVLEKQA